MANGIVFHAIEQNFAPNVFYAAIMRRIVGTMALFEELYDILKLPGYFGFNWDALYDCLCDFHWIEAHQIIIAHNVLPDLSTNDFKTYLGVLHDATEMWGSNKEHSLEVRFNQVNEILVLSLLY